MERERIIDKIRKCMALGESSNEHEAAAALRQAQKLMAAHNVSADEIDAAVISEFAARNAKKGERPDAWQARLHRSIAEAFGVDVLIKRKRVNQQISMQFLFVGEGAAPEVAGYVMDVLWRKAFNARANYVAGIDYKQKSKAEISAMGEVFIEAWTMSIQETVRAFAIPIKNQKGIDSYLAKTYGELSKVDSTRRRLDVSREDAEAAALSGAAAGAEVQIQNAVQAKARENQKALS